MTYRAVTRRVFWRAWREGLSAEEAAGRAGVSVSVGRRWIRERGGMCDVELAEPSGRYLSLTERETIMVRLAEKVTLRAIARELGRPPSTISREIARNGTAKARCGYRAVRAQGLAEQRARRPKTSKLAGEDRLRAYVQGKLTCRARWSPEQIAGR